MYSVPTLLLAGLEVKVAETQGMDFPQGVMVPRHSYREGSLVHLGHLVLGDPVARGVPGDRHEPMDKTKSAVKLIKA